VTSSLQAQNLEYRGATSVAFAFDYVALKFARNEQLKSRQFFAETAQGHQQFG